MLRTDHGGEFISTQFCNYCKENGIKRQLTIRHTPQQKGVAERKNRTIVEMESPTKAVQNKTPYEAWHHQKPRVDFLKVFGCVAYALLPSQNREKLDQKGEKYIFIGYSDESKGYRLLNPKKNKLGKEDKIYRLRKALYGLKQAPRAWNSKIDKYLCQNGFMRSKNEPSLCVKKEGTKDFLMLCLYVDDLIYTGTNANLLEEFKQTMIKEYEMIDLGLMRYFLGIQVQQSKGEFFISQGKYLEDLLKRFHMTNCKPVTTPIASNEKLQQDDGAEKVDPTIFRKLVVSLIYLTNTRPNIAFAVNLVSRFMSNPSKLHFIAAKRILLYLSGTKKLGIKYVEFEGSEKAISLNLQSLWKDFDNLAMKESELIHRRASRPDQERNEGSFQKKGQFGKGKRVDNHNKWKDSGENSQQTFGFTSQVKLGDGKLQNAEGKGTIAVYTRGDYSVHFDVGKCKIFYKKNNLTVANVKMSKSKVFPLMFPFDEKFAFKAVSADLSSLWHLRYGHLNNRGLHLLKEKNMVVGLLEIEKSGKVCEGCIYGKMHKLPFPKTSWRAKAPLELVHSDIYSPMRTPSLGSK
ncbi:hypothetical protein EZV62_022366 [Acer yangbiense]|uniref:Integrase catalytic domain-containing protein n=1 Tax=Acer yangbiense TaxID=1000413 RepID=A0A5C7H875_9ROSI|nr:hypothetical protein EZV62_022366 [Acer yangbiense]